MVPKSEVETSNILKLAPHKVAYGCQTVLHGQGHFCQKQVTMGDTVCSVNGVLFAISLLLLHFLYSKMSRSAVKYLFYNINDYL